MPEKGMGNNCPSLSTAQKIGVEYKVAPRTIKNDASFAEAVDRISTLSGPEVRRSILSRDTPFTKKEVVKVNNIAKTDPEGAKKLLDKVISGESKSVKEAQSNLKHDAESEALQALKDSDSFRLLTGDLLEASQEIEPDSIDVIITDPPYSEDSLPLYSRLAELASRVLKPGGSLVVMTGQSYLPEVLELLGTRLTYHWSLAYLTPGGQSAQLWQRKVNTFWKPVLWFVKGNYDGDWIGDVASSSPNDNDKRYHTWGQSESGMADIVGRFSKPGDLILDPFLGGGTTGSVAVTMGRKFVGIDISSESVETARARLMGVVDCGQ